jgi:hypothetical protein
MVLERRGEVIWKVDVFAGGARLTIEIETFRDGQVVVVLDTVYEASSGRRTRDQRSSSLLAYSEVSGWLEQRIETVIEAMRAPG